MSIKQISEMTGASLSTVSRVLNDPNHKCADENMRKKIFDAARILNYVPNENARGLKSGIAAEKRIYYIDILLTRDESDPFFNELLRIAEVYAHNNMFVIRHILHNRIFSDFRRCKFENISKIVDDMCRTDEKPADGLMVFGKTDRSVITELYRYYRNIISLSRNYEDLNVDELICDGNRNTRLAIEHLVSLGHRKIAYAGNAENESRYDGYLKTLLNFGIMHNLHYVFECPAEFEKGIDAFDYFRNLADPPTAVYCSNDIIALGMLKSLSRNSKKWHYQPSVISSDDIDEAQYSTPMLTTVRLPKEEMIRFAFVLLKDRILGLHKTVLKMEFRGSLIIRESTRPVGETMECEYYI